MVEFSLLLPIILMLVFFGIDAGRLVYTYNVIASAARDGARTASLASQTTSDCLALQRVINDGQGFSLQADPNSIQGNTDPNHPGAVGPSAPPAGQGYVYVYPAVATQDPPAQNCSGQQRQWATSAVHDVSVQVSYAFQPMTPLVGNLLHITVTSISVEQAEPCPGATC